MCFCMIMTQKKLSFVFKLPQFIRYYSVEMEVVRKGNKCSMGYSQGKGKQTNCMQIGHLWDSFCFFRPHLTCPFFFLMFFDSDKALFLKLVELLSVVTTERVTFVFLADLLLNLFN